jgi:hypothetical protein
MVLTRLMPEYISFGEDRELERAGRRIFDFRTILRIYPAKSRKDVLFDPPPGP